MKIVVVGCGVVGGALVKWLNENTQHEIFEFDPGLGLSCDLKEMNAAFLCVPVPTVSSGGQDVTIVEDYVESFNSDCDVFIRSTILPPVAEMYHKNNGWHHVPEFLTERTRHEDMAEQGVVCSEEASLKLRKIFGMQKKFYVQKSEYDCAIVKYAHNCFGAMKVNFFNEIFKVCQDYDKVLEGVLSSGYINKNHTMVPGPDKKHGYGGKCFLKDMEAFAYFTSITSLAAAIQENKDNRKYEIKE